MLGCWGWGRGGGPPERQRWGQGHDQVPLCLFQKIIVMSWQVPWILNLVMPSIPTSLPPKVKDEEETSLQPFFFFKYRDYRLVQPTSKTHCFFKKKLFFLLIFGYTGSTLLCVGFLELWCSGFSLWRLLLFQSSGSRECKLLYLRCRCTGLVAPWHVGSSWTRGRTWDRTRVLCDGRWILYHQITRVVLVWPFWTGWDCRPVVWLALSRWWPKNAWRLPFPSVPQNELVLGLHNWQVSSLDSHSWRWKACFSHLIPEPIFAWFQSTLNVFQECDQYLRLYFNNV